LRKQASQIGWPFQETKKEEINIEKEIQKSTSIFWRHVILNAGSVSQNLERKSCCL